MSDVTVDADAFGSELSAILGRLGDGVERGLRPAVAEGAKVARREWSARAPRDTGAYASSISYRVTGHGYEAEAEVGSATLPGLPHLLEKGHARVGGGRVPGQVHIAPAAEEAFEATERAFDELADDSIAEAAS